MPSQNYVRPPLVAREATPPWVARWRFRAFLLALLAVLIVVGFVLFQQYTGANAQDPGVGASALLDAR